MSENSAYNFILLSSTIQQKMGGSQRRKGMKGRNKTLHRAIKTKHYLRDHDQIHEDLKNPTQYEKLEIDESKPGSGQHYCIGCARYFESDETLKVHQGTKKHKRMVKKMLEQPYTHEEAYEAGK